MCAICSATKENNTTVFFREISDMNHDFKEFIINGNINRCKSTRSGTGIGEGDSLCSACYQTYIKKHYTNKGRQNLSAKHDHVNSENNTIEPITSSNKSHCVYCPNVYEKYTKNKGFRSSKYSECPVTTQNRSDLKLVKMNVQVAANRYIDETGNIIHSQCQKDLYNEARKFKTCLFCKKSIYKSPKQGTSSKIKDIDTDTLNNIISYRLKSNEFVADREYKSSIHEFCYGELQTVMPELSTTADLNMEQPTGIYLYFNISHKHEFIIIEIHCKLIFFYVLNILEYYLDIENIDLH
jgi:hypothetical protein